MQNHRDWEALPRGHQHREVIQWPPCQPCGSPCLDPSPTALYPASQDPASTPVLPIATWTPGTRGCCQPDLSGPSLSWSPDTHPSAALPTPCFLTDTCRDRTAPPGPLPNHRQRSPCFLPAGRVSAPSSLTLTPFCSVVLTKLLGSRLHHHPQP